ncbi:MAG: Rieske (2Fe-2S) protein, partial [Deltaproteobacteria bacterium]|nr:Rieske (2Fe-2S) protein [Deltaproteobacteria bacterium]
MADIKFNKRNIFQRFLGIPVTLKPGNPKCWNYAGGKLTIDLNQAPELKQAGGALRFEGGGLPARVLVMREDDDGFRALQNRCTHMG